MLPRLRRLATCYSGVGDVRGRGAMLALELVVPGTRTPDPETARAVAASCHEQGLLVLVCGTHGNVIRRLRPLVIGPELLDDALTVLELAVLARA